MELQQHAASMGRCLFFHAQYDAALGVTLVFRTATGEEGSAVPLRVMDDSGASCNLMSRAYAERIGAATRPVARRIYGSTGGSSSTSTGVVADLVVAAGTAQESRVEQQLFLLVDGVTLFDVLVGNRITRFGPLESHVDGKTHRYHYTTSQGGRATLPMVALDAATRDGSAQAAASWADLAELYGWPAHAMAAGSEWEVALATAADKGPPTAAPSGADDELRAILQLPPDAALERRLAACAAELNARDHWAACSATPIVPYFAAEEDPLTRWEAALEDPRIGGTLRGLCSGFWWDNAVECLEEVVVYGRPVYTPADAPCDVEELTLLGWAQNLVEYHRPELLPLWSTEASRLPRPVYLRRPLTVQPCGPLLGEEPPDRLPGCDSAPTAPAAEDGTQTGAGANADRLPGCDSAPTAPAAEVGTQTGAGANADRLPGCDSAPTAPAAEDGTQTVAGADAVAADAPASASAGTEPAGATTPSPEANPPKRAAEGWWKTQWGRRRTCWEEPQDAVACFLSEAAPAARWGGVALLLMNVVLWHILSEQWLSASLGAVAASAWAWQGEACFRTLALPVARLAWHCVQSSLWAAQAVEAAHRVLVWRPLRCLAAGIGWWVRSAAPYSLPPSRAPPQGLLTRHHVRLRKRVARVARAPGRLKNNRQKHRVAAFPRTRANAPVPALRVAGTSRPRLALAGLTLLALLAAGAIGLNAGTLFAHTAPSALPGAVAALGLVGAAQGPAVWANATVSAFVPDGAYLPPPGTHYTKDDQFGWLYGNHRAFTPDHLAELQQTVRSLKHCFAFELSDLTGYTGPMGDFRIRLSHDRAIHEGPRRCSPAELQVQLKAVREWLAAGFCEVCVVNGRYACNMVVAAKKDEHGEWTALRTCHDLRRLNAATLREEHGLHHVDDLFQWLGGKKIYTKLDLRSGFYQIPIAPEDRDKTAFWCDRVLYRFVRMPFGLKCAPIFFQRAVDCCLAEGNCMDCARGFIDDIIIASDTPEEHVRDVARVLEALNKHGLKVHPHKSVFGAECVEYLGHNVSRYGHSPTEAKVAAIQKMPAPSNVSELRAVLGLLSYYRCYCRDFGAIAAPLTALTAKNCRWEWGAPQHQALSELKSEICAPGKALRPIDYSRPIFLHTDWSCKGIGAVIGQKDADGQEYMCACISRSLNAAEQRYEASKGEMLAAVWAIKQFRPFLYGVPFTLVTDHAALKWLFTNPHVTGQYARWAAIIQEHELAIEHRQGQAHQNADALSRLPLPCTHDASGARLDPEAPLAALAASIVCGGGNEPTTGLAHALALMAGPTHEQMMADPAAEASAVMATCLEQALATGTSFIDTYAPTSFNLFSGHNGSLLDLGEVEPWADEPAAMTARERMHRKAAKWVREAMQADAPAQPSAPLAWRPEPGPADVLGVRPTSSLNTTPLAPSFFAKALEEGIVLFEPFGGLCAGLEMVLRGGVPVKQYVYCDNHLPCQEVARHRVAALAARYPSLLSLDATARMLSIPQDVRLIGAAELAAAGALNGSQWMVVAGWECQDLSAAGSGKGLQGRRSSTFYDLLRIVGALQQLQRSRPPAYLLENTHMHHSKGTVQAIDYPEICRALGRPISLDAAQCGSYAHRLRNYWTNLADSAVVAHVFAKAVRRAPDLYVDSILDEGRVTRPVQFTTSSSPSAPWYVCNKGSTQNPGKRCALPTLMATQRSYSFRDGKAGCIYQAGTHPLQLADPPEPNADERERALGYETGATAAPGVSTAQRHRITGGCMDANALEHLFAISLYVTRWACPPAPPESGRVTSPVAAGPAGTPAAAPLESFQPWSDAASAAQHALAAAAEIGETGRDIWEDEAALQYLRSRQVPEGATDAERRRLQRRAQKYTWQSGRLYRRMADGSVRVVPTPDQRAVLVQQTHEGLGHLGTKRTAALVASKFWWRGMYENVTAVVSTCEPCSRAKASFNQSQPELCPLPIKGLFYRWGVDLAGPFPKTARGHAYAMVCIEHWSKTVVITPIPDKEAATTAFAFLHSVLARFGAPAEVLTDQGSEWCDEFQRLLTDTFVDHRSTSASHPASNGLTERAVQTLKGALAKHCLAEESTADWDKYCAWLALGYNCSPQESTRLAPYHVLFGRAPAIPASVQAVIAAPLSFDDPLAVTLDVLQRAEAVRRACPAIDENLAIAQHRDTQRYQAVRSGMYVGGQGPPLAAGDFVWLKRHQTSSTLQTGTMPPILRVQKVWPAGMLTLMGKCGRTLKAHASHCARCSLPNIDPTVNPALQPYDRNLQCEVCHSPQGEASLLLCDGCGRGWHNGCLASPLTEIPPAEEVWVCPDCLASGVTELEAAGRRAAAGPEARLPEGVVFPNARARRYLQECAELEGRVVAKQFAHPVHQKPHTYWGRVHFRGKEARPEYFLVRYTDGDEETMTLRELRKVLKPDGARIPASAYNEPSPAARRPSRRPRGAVANVTAPTWVADRLHAGMPGTWPQPNQDRVAAAAEAYLRGDLPALPYRPAAVEPLLAAVDLPACLTVADPFGDHAAIASGLTKAGISMVVD
ncbi:hypothetical protein MNEG_11595 [Monoraphidium neglectum]|uniref:Reverse transcriptase n=1 Tax=Monoraphidium neglectum TaxID=145388 RepID=A0A0D2J9E5_9CHLO|nr:hypothetical protein MNEG_11595 [Monoraphidium neglectum]KIY96367.1 hypothetical protein MNEG_11595 [Monoraphidium neglectum]|eukprot:XP_013895387.1 hypothetical protein MNEG_11595 [Monoraphidium neglectum]